MTADQIYVDPSALASLYLHEPDSRIMTRWRLRIGGTLLVTHHGRIEMVNAICLAVFRERLDQDFGQQALRDLAADFADGHFRQADFLWRSALNCAADLSSRFTPVLGTRSMDILHIACAVELKLPYFLSFDDRQRKLAVAVGLRLVQV